MTPMRHTGGTRGRLLPACVLAALAAAAPARDADLPDPQVTAQELIGHIRKLSHDDWQGRGAGSEGEKLATDYIAAQFERLGLEPAGQDGTWFQAAKVGENVTIEAGCVLAATPARGKRLTLVEGKDFTPFRASANGDVEAEAVFAGFGITAPQLKYDDYAGLDVKGKVVVIFRQLPSDKAPWRGRGVTGRYATFVAKLDQAQKRGAAALVLINNPRDYSGKKDRLHTGGIGGATAKIPFMHVTRSGGTKLLKTLFGAGAKKLEAACASGTTPKQAVRKSGRLKAACRLAREPITGRNVCALLRPGAKETFDEYVVIGGHHDHVGLGNHGGSRAGRSGIGKIHNGADDNASGTAGVLEAAGYLASRQEELRRPILFITFTGEERGLLGSKWWVDHPTVELQKVAAMINMDMVGRLGKKPLWAGGVGTATAFRPLIEKRAAEIPIKVKYGDGGVAPSDNTSFYRKDIPVLFFFTGLHADYHLPTDDADKIDKRGIEKVVRLAAEVTFDIANLGRRPVFKRADTGGMPGGPPRLGITVGAGDGGVGVTGLAPGGAADKAGVKVGDVILALGRTPTPDMPGLRRALRKLKPGSKHKLKVRRGAGIIALTVVFPKG